MTTICSPVRGNIAAIAGVPRIARSATDAHCRGDVSEAARIADRVWRDARSRRRDLLESDERYSAVGNDRVREYHAG